MSNSFGDLFRITTWGESHGPAIGVVVDGCPAGIEIDVAEIAQELLRRAPGNSPYTSPRKEADTPELLSGIFQGKTTGAPISILIRNRDVDSTPYTQSEHLLRPGHAHYTYLMKYGHIDHRGSGRASARETACRVAAGAIAKKLLKHASIELFASLGSIGTITAHPEPSGAQERRDASPLFCADPTAEASMLLLLEEVLAEGDSIGGTVTLTTSRLPIGLGDPVYAKLEAKLASAMLSLPASKGFEIGLGMEAAHLRGSQHNDTFHTQDGTIALTTNRAGGTLGGISTGEPLHCHIAFKPPSSIKKTQETVTLSGTSAQLTITGRHDTCVAIRAVPIVEAMAALVLADCLLLQRARCSFQ